jgi:hypothetical protein
MYLSKEAIYKRNWLREVLSIEPRYVVRFVVDNPVSGRILGFSKVTIIKSLFVL